MATHRLHVIGLPHTQTTLAYSTCAYTEKVRKLSRMMHERGHHVMLYTGEQNEAPCSEHIPCISEEERAAAVGTAHYTAASFDTSLPHWQTFLRNAINEIRARALPRDFICLSVGEAQKAIADAFPAMMAVETGIGYGGSFAQYRVWESYAWMHTCYSKQKAGTPHDIDGQWFDAVIPGYFEPERFPFKKKKGENLLFVGRMIERKGIHTALQIANACGRQLITAGPGEGIAGAIHVGEVGPIKRAELMGNARALLAPTTYVEPFGNVVVEAMACGTPVITTDWGAFTETVEQGVTGFRCRSLREFVNAVRDVPTLRPTKIRKRALARYSLATIGLRYEEYFDRLSTLWASGWPEL